MNLGIGQPTRIAEHLPRDAGVVLHTENGMLGMGSAATGDEIDPDLTNAGQVPVTELPGAAYFHHADTGTPATPTRSPQSAARWTSPWGPVRSS